MTFTSSFARHIWQSSIKKLFGHRPIDRSRTWSRGIKPALEPLEERLLLSSMPQWVEQGPGPIQSQYGETTLPSGGRQGQIGAIESLAVEPINNAADNTEHFIVYAGTVNGGIWRAGYMNSSGQWSGDITPAMLAVVKGSPAADPTTISWVPLSDYEPSLAISSLALDPNDLTGNTLWAGTGSLSSDGTGGGAGVGLLKTSDGGLTWTVLGTAQFSGQHILSVVPTVDLVAGKQVILVASQETGIWRSQDGGLTFQQPNYTSIINPTFVPSPLTGTGTDLIPDPLNSDRFYAAVVNFGGITQSGIFESDDAGASWNEIDQAGTISQQTLGVKLATQINGQTILFFATEGITPASDVDPNGNPIGEGITSAFFATVRSSGGVDLGGWTQLGSFTPVAARADFRPGYDHFAAVADPTQIGTFYVGSYQDNIYRVRMNDGWTNLFHVNGSNPHVDERQLAFLGPALLVADDGGVYGLDSPANAGNSGYPSQWVALNSNLRDNEMGSVQFDPNDGLLFGASQDNDVNIQSQAGSFSWEHNYEDPTGGGDGGGTAVSAGGDDYYTTNSSGLNWFSFPEKQAKVALAGWDSNLPQNIGAFAGNLIQPHVIMLGSSPDSSNLTKKDFTTKLFESNNAGTTVTDVTPASFNSDVPVTQYNVVKNVAYATNSPMVAYFSTFIANKDGSTGPGGGRLWIRTDGLFSSNWTELPTPAGWDNTSVNVQAMAIDPNDYHFAYFLLTDGQVWETSNAGAARQLDRD